MVSLASVAVCPTAVLAQAQGGWTQTGAMQSPRELDAQVPLSSGEVLTMGGLDNNGNVLSTAEIYSPSTGAWNLTGAMATAREHFPAVVLKNGMVLVTGGLTTGGTVLNSAELYDPSAGGWSAAGAMSLARFGHTATLLKNGEVLVAGGCSANPCSGATTESELYDPTTNSWSVTGSLSTGRLDHAAVLLATQKVLVVGGGVGVTSSEIYDPKK
jgi:N-acetylneuraminic acid mutarotase